MRKIIALTFLSFFSINATFSQEDFTKYVDPTIGNVARFLVPTYPTMHLPNQMIRMFPVKKDYISDQVDAFPLQVTGHRRPGIFQMKVTLGDISNDSWKNNSPANRARWRWFSPMPTRPKMTSSSRACTNPSVKRSPSRAAR